MSLWDRIARNRVTGLRSQGLLSLGFKRSIQKVTQVTFPSRVTVPRNAHVIRTHNRPEAQGLLSLGFKRSPQNVAQMTFPSRVTSRVTVPRNTHVIRTHNRPEAQG